jgi:hypothetical protein
VFESLFDAQETDIDEEKFANLLSVSNQGRDCVDKQNED